MSAIKEALLRAATEEAVLSTLCDREWPNAPARILRTPFVAEWEARVLHDPLARWAAAEPIAVVEIVGERQVIPRFSTATPTEHTVGALDEMPLYAGQGIGRIEQL